MSLVQVLASRYYGDGDIPNAARDAASDARVLLEKLVPARADGMCSCLSFCVSGCVGMCASDFDI